jgi:hypothetical protein
MWLARIIVDVIHFLFKESSGKDSFGVVIIFPYFVVLLFGVFHFTGKEFQSGRVSFCLQLAEDTIRGLAFEISHHICQWVRLRTLPREMGMIVHDDKTVKFEPFSEPETVEGVQNDPLDNITLEDMQVVYSFGGDKVEMVRVKVRFPRGHRFSFIGGFVNPPEPSLTWLCWTGKSSMLADLPIRQSNHQQSSALLDCQVQRIGGFVNPPEPSLTWLGWTAKSSILAGFVNPARAITRLCWTCQSSVLNVTTKSTV